VSFVSFFPQTTEEDIYSFTRLSKLDDVKLVIIGQEWVTFTPLYAPLKDEKAHRSVLSSLSAHIINVRSFHFLSLLPPPVTSLTQFSWSDTCSWTSSWSLLFGQERSSSPSELEEHLQGDQDRVPFVRNPEERVSFSPPSFKLEGQIIDLTSILYLSDLTSLATQGVLLLNTSLTVRANTVRLSLSFFLHPQSDVSLSLTLLPRPPPIPKQAGSL